jgi:hypothetical protein
VSFPAPHPGLVIRYSYLWRREHLEGRVEGTKDRPCAVVMSVVDDEGEQEILVLPITHTPPANPADAVEIPVDTKNRLGLDFDRSWIVITEANEFLWPGPDLRPIPGRDDSTIAYGTLAPRFFAHVRERFLKRDRSEKSTRVPRTE